MSPGSRLQATRTRGGIGQKQGLPAKACKAAWLSMMWLECLKLTTHSNLGCPGGGGPSVLQH